MSSLEYADTLPGPQHQLALAMSAVRQSDSGEDTSKDTIDISAPVSNDKSKGPTRPVEGAV